MFELGTGLQINTGKLENLKIQIELLRFMFMATVQNVLHARVYILMCYTVSKFIVHHSTTCFDTKNSTYRGLVSTPTAESKIKADNHTL